MKSITFSERNIKELLRDPISYIFLIIFPIAMLLVMTGINAGIPDYAQMTIYNIENLSAGICIFGFSFDMLFAALQISSDRNTSFLVRLYSSPMSPADFIIGYTLPLVLTALLQCLIIFGISAIIGVTAGYTFNLLNVLLSVLVMLPSALLFISIGIMFGTLFNHKAAPPLSSVIITVSGMLGGVWMDPDKLGSPMTDICKLLPTASARAAISGSYSDIGFPLMIVTVYAVLLFTASLIAFFKKSKI